MRTGRGGGEGREGHSGRIETQACSTGGVEVKCPSVSSRESRK